MGLGSFNVSIKPTASTAATKVSKEPALTAVSTMSAISVTQSPLRSLRIVNYLHKYYLEGMAMNLIFLHQG
jgi:hypothetical protein